MLHRLLLLRTTKVPYTVSARCSSSGSGTETAEKTTARSRQPAGGGAGQKKTERGQKKAEQSAGQGLGLAMGCAAPPESLTPCDLEEVDHKAQRARRGVHVHDPLDTRVGPQKGKRKKQGAHNDDEGAAPPAGGSGGAGTWRSGEVPSIFGAAALRPRPSPRLFSHLRALTGAKAGQAQVLPMKKMLPTRWHHTDVSGCTSFREVSWVAVWRKVAMSAMRLVNASSRWAAALRAA